MQNNGTKTMHLKKHFEELIDKAKQTGGMDRQNQQGSGRKRTRGQPAIEKICVQSPRIESVVTLATEWFSLGGDDGKSGSTRTL